MTGTAVLTYQSADKPMAERHTRRRGPFQSGMLTKTERMLRTEARLLGANTVTVEVDGGVRVDGKPAVTRLRSPAVAVYLETRHGPLRYFADGYSDWEDNLRAVALSLEALRAVDRWGATGSGQQYLGFKALPPAGQPTESAVAARAVLLKYAGRTVDEGETNEWLVRRAKANTHPDVAGDTDGWYEVRRALDALGLT